MSAFVARAPESSREDGDNNNNNNNGDNSDKGMMSGKMRCLAQRAKTMMTTMMTRTTVARE